jgi:hypothetical protein
MGEPHNRREVAVYRDLNAEEIEQIAAKSKDRCLPVDVVINEGLIPLQIVLLGQNRQIAHQKNRED